MNFPQNHSGLTWFQCNKISRESSLFGVSVEFNEKSRKTFLSNILSSEANYSTFQKSKRCLVFIARDWHGKEKHKSGDIDDCNA